MILRIGLRFLLTGIANTVVGLLIVSLCLWLGWSPYVANASGYAAGLGCGFVMNRRWTFGDRRRALISAPRYLIAFGISYGGNLAVLACSLRVFGLPALLAQAAALSTYSLVFFLLCRYFVFELGAD